VAGVIALDAAFLIAHLNAADAHHQTASDLLEEHADQDLIIGPLNLAEALVAATRSGHLAATQQAIARLAVREVPFPSDAATRLAQLRVDTGSKMPDCCVLLTAEQESASIATFDERLKKSASMLGIDTI
jgi:predicted nucleic acid-binding protein